MNIKVNFIRKLSKANIVNGIVFVKAKKIKNSNLNSILKSVLDNELFQDQLFIQREYKNTNYIFVNCKNLNISTDYENIGSKLFDYLKKNKIENSYFDVSKSYFLNVITNPCGFNNFTYENNSKVVTRESLFDIASLTKVLATVPVIMKLVQKKKIDLDFLLSDFYPEFSQDPKSEITIRHLLTHTSGLKPYVEYYKKDGFNSKDDIIYDIINQELDYIPDSKVVYSDLGMILLYDIIEQITNTPFEKLADKYYYNLLGMNNTSFNPKESLEHKILPTEEDDYFRNRLLKGEVHDENAFLLGGVSGHAGLFSTANDIAKISKMFLDGGVYLGRRHLKRNIVDMFT